MVTKLFVGGLDYGITDEQLRELFETIDSVVSAQVVVDGYSKQSKGFGFVEMSSEHGARDAIARLDGKEFAGRPLGVAQARPQQNRVSGTYSGR
jgi:RNA recognition motif-containing protein